MNATQRKELDKINSELEGLKDRINTIRDDAQSKYDDMSEKTQEGEKGEKLTEEICELESMLNYLEDAISSIENLKDA